MKTDIHPKYFENVKIVCACGSVITAGSTKESLKTELCSACHPFFTGKQKLVDTAGRVDKFEAKRKTAELHKQAKVQAEKDKKLRKSTPQVPAEKKPASKKKAK